MAQFINHKSNLTALAGAVFALIALIAACGGDPTPTPTATPMPTATPTPSPTPTPTPVPDPIVDLSGDATYADLAALMPQEAVDCLVNALGQAAYNGLLAQPVFDFGSDLPLTCFTEDVAISVFIAGLSQAGDGLSDTTVTCIRSTFEGLDIGALGALVSGDLGGGSIDDAFGISVGLLICLTNDEADQITAGGLFGDVGGLAEVSLGDIRCVYEAVDFTVLRDLISNIQDGAVPDLSNSLDLLTAVNNCGISLDDLIGGAMTGDGATSDDGPAMNDTPVLLPGALDIADLDLTNIPGITPELQAQITCFVGEVGEESLKEILNGDRPPGISDLLALTGCGVDLAQLADLSALVGG